MISATISTPKAQRQHVVGVVRCGGDVQEEDQVHADLRDGEHGRARPVWPAPRSGRLQTDVERRCGQRAASTKPIT